MDAENSLGAGDSSDAPGGEDTQSLIKVFRKQRELRRERGTRAIVSLAFVIGFIGLQWADIAQHVNPLPFVPKEDEWAVGFFVNNVGLALAFVGADKLNLEVVWGGLKVQELKNDVRSSTLALGTKFAYLYLYGSHQPSLYRKYGWFMAWGYIYTWLFPVISIGISLATRCQLNAFSPAVTAKLPFLQRRPTVCEWYSTMIPLNFLVYVAVDAEMWSRNQWQVDSVNGSGGSLLGPDLSPIVGILACLVAGARWLYYWGLRSFEQELPEWFHDDRCTLLGSLWMQFNIHLGVVILIRAALQPANQILMGDDQDLLQ
eukprot:SAG11_NODE_7681_length_1111_cov_0.959486_1_plen_315_part_01